MFIQGLRLTTSQAARSSLGAYGLNAPYVGILSTLISILVVNFGPHCSLSVA